jgi:hypothetical protein
MCSNSLAPAVALERIEKLAILLLLARPLKAADPDAAHPGKARE